MTLAAAEAILTYWRRFGTISPELARSTWQHHDPVKLAAEIEAADPECYAALVQSRREHPPDTAGSLKVERLRHQADPDTMAAYEQLTAPVPFVERHDPPDFPLDALPDWIAEHARAVADDIQVPVDLCAQLALGALATAAMGRRKVTLAGTRWTEPANLYLGTAMHSGAGKSPAEKAMCGALRTWEAARMADRAAAVIDAERAHARAVKKAQRLETEHLAGKADEIDVRGAWDEVDQLEIPAGGRIICDDVTPEQLAAIMARNDDRQAILSTEADLIDMASGMYGERGRKVNLGIYLKAWSGDDFRQDRKGDGTNGAAVHMAEPLLTVSITMQPSVVDSLRADPNLVGRGFLARFMLSAPPPLIGRRDVWAVMRDRADTAERYDTELAELAERLHHGDPTTIDTDEAAAARFLAWCAELEPRMGPRGDLSAVAEWSSKAKSSVLRVALLLALCDRRDTVDDAHMTRAIAIGDYWLGQMVAIIDNGTTDEVVGDAIAIADWAAGRDELEFRPIELKDAMRRFRPVEHAIPALALLERHGWLQFVEGAVDEVGTRGRKVVVRLHPDLARFGDEILRVGGPNGPNGPNYHATQKVRTIGTAPLDLAKNTHEEEEEQKQGESLESGPNGPNFSTHVDNQITPPTINPEDYL